MNQNVPESIGPSGGPQGERPRAAAIRERLPSFWSGDIQWDCPLSRYSTLRVGGPATAVIVPGSLPELTALVRELRRQALPWRVIGRGSNILVADQGLAEVIIVLRGQMGAIESGPELNGKRLVRVEAGCGLPRLVAWCVEQGLSGLEFAAGIPGSVGGGVVMNAGAWGRDIGGCLDSLEVIDADGEYRILQAAGEYFAYRGWRGARGRVVLAATFRLQAAPRGDVEGRCRHYLEQRKEKQPQGVASAGSFFKNPAERAAGRLIEEAGLKGTRCGGAAVSEHHANFLVNAGNATAGDFIQLMQLIQERVWSGAGIRLEPEVQLLGFGEIAP